MTVVTGYVVLSAICNVGVGGDVIVVEVSDGGGAVRDVVGLLALLLLMERIPFGWETSRTVVFVCDGFIINSNLDKLDQEPTAIIYHIQCISEWQADMNEQYQGRHWIRSEEMTCCFRQTLRENVKLKKNFLCCALSSASYLSTAFSNRRKDGSDLESSLVEALVSELSRAHLEPLSFQTLRSKIVFMAVLTHKQQTKQA
ncbi:Hypothetical predicted protein [Octopus vulgaris]|uniref:Uncharacterized protein n=1 Tax=Octopus vulgaris TaxID=6645 RepID=A0AA36EYW9_OCTVU|nr:Hypothetical predicted protein [Octopus vulgaris]